MKTLAIIPAYQEDVAIGSVVLRARKYVDEVLVVDDGSTDRTSENAALAGATVIRWERNDGKGVALRRGLDYAREKGFDAAILVDGDGQHNPDEIPNVLKPVLAGESDMVLGLRYGATTKMPFYRRAGKRALDYATAASAGGLLTDSQCGFRALSKAAIDSLVLTEDGFGVESEMIVEARAKNLRVAEVPVSARYDVGKHTKQPLIHGIGVVDRILNIVAVRHPLLIFGSGGLVVFIAGIILGVITLDIYNQTKAFAVGYALLVVIFLLLGALSMFVGVILNILPRALDRGPKWGNHRTEK